jgi:hypothetical protein
MSRSHTALATLAGPPPEVLTQVAEAWERAQEPIAGHLELHFESEPALGRGWAVLRHADGTIAERLCAAAAVALACGDIVAPGIPVAV